MKTPRDSQVEMTEMVLPQHTNSIGTVFGGTVMSWVDIAAAISALRHAGLQVVTASVDAMEFHAPIRLGWVVTIKAMVNYVSRSSCEVGVKVFAENPLTAESFHTASAYLTMVALDSNGRPAMMRKIFAETDEEKRRYSSAEKRRELRLQLKKANLKRLKEKGDI